MNKLRKPLLLSLLLCSCLCITAQELYQKGFVLRSPLDTLHGEIKYISYNQAAAQCIFRDSTHRETVFLPQDIYGYGVTDNLLFFSKRLDDQGPMYLEVIYQGTLTLYSYRDINARNYYYVESNETGEFRPLTQKIVGNNRRQKVFKTYIDVLKIMLPKSELVADEIEGVSLSSKSLSRLLSTYDERYANTLGITYSGIAGTSPPRLGLLAGTIYSRLTLNGHRGNVNQQFVSAGVRLEKEVSRGTGRLFLSADLLITDESYRGEFAAQQVITQDNDIVSNFINFALTADYVGVSGPIDYRTYAELSRTVISMPVNLKYKLPGKRFNITFGGGIEVQYATSSDVVVDGRVFQDGMVAYRAFTQEFANPFRLGMNIGVGLAYNAKRTVFLDTRFSPAWLDQGALNYRYMRLMLGIMLNKN